MVNLVKNDPFLSHVSKLGKQLKEKRIIRLTIKRDLNTRFPELRKSLRHKKRDEVIQSIKQSLENDAEPVPVLIRAQQNNNKAEHTSTQVLQKHITSFSNQLANIFRLWCFQEAQEKQQKRQVLKPTPADPKSKRQGNVKEKKRRNQERRKKLVQLQRLKKREEQRQRTFASKQQQQ